MSTPVRDAPTDASPPPRPPRPVIPRLIRTLALPIILGWIAVIVILNTVVPQLETVGQMRAVSMSPDDAPSLISMKQVGEAFKEVDSDSSAMIVLEGDKPLGDEAHRYYDQLVDKLEADTKHVQHVAGLLGRPADRRRVARARRQGRLRPGLARRQPG